MTIKGVRTSPLSYDKGLTHYLSVTPDQQLYNMDSHIQRMRNLLRTIMIGIFWDLLRGRMLLLKEKSKLVLIFVGIWANRTKLTILDLMYFLIRLRPLVMSQLRQIVGRQGPDKAGPSDE